MSLLISQIYNWLTFDIIGDLSFGEPFGSVANAETHPWVHTIKQVIADQVYHHVFYRLPWLKLCPSIIRPRDMAKFSAQMVQYTNDLVARRRAKGNDRDDFFAHVLSNKATNLSTDFLRAQASTLVVAGSETTATFLAGMSICMKRKNYTDGIVQVSHITSSKILPHCSILHKKSAPPSQMQSKSTATQPSNSPTYSP